VLEHEAKIHNGVENLSREPDPGRGKGGLGDGLDRPQRSLSLFCQE